MSTSTSVVNWHETAAEKPPEPSIYASVTYLCTVDNKQVVTMSYSKDVVKGRELLRWHRHGRLSPWGEPIAWAEMPAPYEERNMEYGG